MNMPRQTRRLVLACAGLLLAGGPLRAAETAPPAGRVMDLSYEVYLGGMHIFSMDVDMALRSDGYSVAAAGGTRGVIGWIYKWDVKVAAEGQDQAGDIRPLVYQSAMDWQKNPRVTRLAFTGKGAYDVQRTPPPEPDPDDDNSAARKHGRSAELGGRRDPRARRQRPMRANLAGVRRQAALRSDDQGPRRSDDRAQPLFDLSRSRDALRFHHGADFRLQQEVQPIAPMGRG